MRRIQLAVAAIAVVASVAAAAPASAQGARVGAQPTYASAANRADVASDSVAFAQAQSLAERADQRWHAYDLVGARRDLQRAVEILRGRQLYAGPTLVSLAEVTYTTDTPVKAERVLLDAADDAAAFGDIAVQVQSLFEASLLYRDAGDEGQSAKLLDSARKLLQSPYLPQDTKEKIARRIKA